MKTDSGSRADIIVKMKDLKLSGMVESYDEIIENRQKELAKIHNFKILDHSMILYGEFSDEE